MTGQIMATTGAVLLCFQIATAHRDRITVVKVKQIEVVALRMPVRGCFR